MTEEVFKTGNAFVRHRSISEKVDNAGSSLAFMPSVKKEFIHLHALMNTLYVLELANVARCHGVQRVQPVHRSQ